MKKKLFIFCKSSRTKTAFPQTFTLYRAVSSSACWAWFFASEIHIGLHCSNSSTGLADGKLGIRYKYHFWNSRLRAATLTGTWNYGWSAGRSLESRSWWIAGRSLCDKAKARRLSDCLSTWTVLLGTVNSQDTSLLRHLQQLLLYLSLHLCLWCLFAGIRIRYSLHMHFTDNAREH